MAANNKGIQLVQELIQEYSLKVVQAYMHYIQARCRVNCVVHRGGEESRVDSTESQTCGHRIAWNFKGGETRARIAHSLVAVTGGALPTDCMLHGGHIFSTFTSLTTSHPRGIGASSTENRTSLT